MNAINTVWVGYARCSTDEQDVVIQTDLVVTAVRLRGGNRRERAER